MSGERTALDNAAVVRAAYAAFGRGDLAALDGLIAPDVRWHVPGRGPLAGDYVGREAVYDLFGRLAALTGSSLRQELHTVLADDDHGVALVEERAERDGRVVVVRVAQVLHLREGRITEFWEAPLDPAAYEELFGG